MLTNEHVTTHPGTQLNTGVGGRRTNKYLNESLSKPTQTFHTLQVYCWLLFSGAVGG